MIIIVCVKEEETEGADEEEVEIEEDHHSPTTNSICTSAQDLFNFPAVSGSHCASPHLAIVSREATSNARSVFVARGERSQKVAIPGL